MRVAPSSAGLRLNVSRTVSVYQHRQVKPRYTTVANADTGASQLLEAFFYGRAFAVTLNKRLGEAVTDVIAEVSKFIAENPTRMQEFQEEVEAMARADLQGSSGLPETVSTSQIPSSSSPSTTSPQPAQVDLQAIVDDLRAEIASSRSVLQQIKSSRVETN